MAIEISYDEIKRRIVDDENTNDTRLFSIITSIQEEGIFKVNKDTAKDCIATYNNGKYILVFTTNNYAYEFATLSKLYLGPECIRTVRYSDIKDCGIALIADGLCFESRIVKEFGTYTEGTEKQILVESYCKIIWKNRDKLFTPGFNILSLPDNEEGSNVYQKFINKLSSNYLNVQMYNIADIILYEDYTYNFNSEIMYFMSNLYNFVFVIDIDTFGTDIRVIKVFNDFCFAVHNSSLLKGNIFIFITRYGDKINYGSKIPGALQVSSPKSIAYLSNSIVAYNSQYDVYHLHKCISVSDYYGITSVNFDDII